MNAGAVSRFIVAIAACSAGAALAGGREIDQVAGRPFSFGPMAIGQARDLDYARAEGLGVVPTIPLNAYLDGVLAKLLAGSPVTQVPARVYVRASGDWSAKSTADANIYVSLGILLRLDNEDEVAALLAHEASHVILGHANADVVQSVQQRAIQLSALALEAQRSLAEAKGRTSAAGGQSGADGARTAEQSRALLLNTTLLSPSWTRDQERAADRLGTDLAMRAGYSPQGMVSLLQKQKEFETERAADPQAASLDSQLLGIDATAKGQQQIEATAAKLGVTGELFGRIAGAALLKTKELASKGLDQASRSHPRTEERIADIRSYIAKEYADSPPGEPNVQGWEDSKEADGTVDVLENYIAAIEAKGKLSGGDVAAARPLAKAGVSGPTKTHAYPNYVDAAVQVAAGTTGQAQADYEAALTGPEPAGAIYVGYGTLLLESGERDRAVEIMEAGYARLEEPPALTVPMIRTYRRVGRQADADRLAMQCALRWPTMQALCAGEATGQ
jgi:Zn-dependent protease with chaperone function